MRQFLALELPRHTRDELTRLQERLAAGLSGWRFARPEAIHLTLRFLGQVDPVRDRAAREAWRHAAAESCAFSFGLRGLGVFPPRGRPRILWVGLSGVEPPVALDRLAGSLEQTARGLGFVPEVRHFRPHLTLARCRSLASPQAPSGMDFTSVNSAQATEVVLFQSEMHPAGARYTALDRFPLGR